MMAARVDRSRQRSAQASAAHADELAPRFLRGVLEISIEPPGQTLATGDRDLAWQPLAEHGTAPMAPAQDSATGPRIHDHATTRSEREVDGVDVDGAPVDGAAALQGVRARIVGDLYASSYHRVFAFARRLVCDEEAEEIAHEAFVRLLRVRNLERMTVSVAYLLRIAENLVRRRHGRAQRYREVLERSGRMGPEIEVIGERSVGAGTRGVCTESAWSDPERLQSVLCRLTPSEQSAIRLIVCEGLDYQAAARSLGVPVSTINNWKHRALAKLKQIIESDGTLEDIREEAVGSRSGVGPHRAGRVLEAC